MITDYTSNSQWGGRPREMGEYIPPTQTKKTENSEFRPREMGEYNIPSREEQGDYFQKSQKPSMSTTVSDNYRPREMGETIVPQRAEKREMTAQEKALDLYA